MFYYLFFFFLGVGSIPRYAGIIVPRIFVLLTDEIVKRVRIESTIIIHPPSGIHALFGPVHPATMSLPVEGTLTWTRVMGGSLTQRRVCDFLDSL